MALPGKLAFRLKQESANLWLWASNRPGRHAGSGTPQTSPLPALPDPAPVVERLRGGAFAAEIDRLAQEVLDHRFPLFGSTIETGPQIEWGRDYVHGITTGNTYSRLVPFLDASAVGDHKVVWELNRHQHLVLLAQAFRLTGRAEYRDEIENQLRSWLDRNPYLRGINWASALEVAFRSLSWVWVYHLAGGWMDEPLQARFLQCLDLHARYLEHNLSVYFSPNTHLLGEGVALHLGTRKYFTITESGLILLEELAAWRSEAELVQALVARYDVTPQHAGSSVREFLERCRRADLLLVEDT